MVDLVKIRRMAKEKKDAERAKESTEFTEPVVDAPPPTAVTPARKKKAAKAKVARPKTSSKKKSRSEAALTPSSTSTEPAVKPEPSVALEAPTPPAKPAEPVEKAVSAVEPSGSVDRTDSEEVSLEPPQEVAQPAAEERVDVGSVDRLEKFKREAGKRRGWFTEVQKGAGVSEVGTDTGELELLRFRLAGEEYAVDIEKIVEIVPPRGTTRVPNADPTIVGIMSLRGTIVTVFDLRRKLGHPPLVAEQGIDPRMIVVERAGETAGFLVDRVSRVVKLDPSEIESHPVVSAAEQSDYVDGVFQASDGLVILLDLERILASQN